jgi:hypothetical protein
MKKFVLYASCICFIYFTALLITNFIGYSNKVIDFFRELLTIPCLAILVIVFIMALLGLKKERYTLKSSYFFSLLISLTTIILLIINSF